MKEPFVIISRDDKFKIFPELNAEELVVEEGAKFHTSRKVTAENVVLETSAKWTILGGLLDVENLVLEKKSTIYNIRDLKLNNLTINERGELNLMEGRLRVDGVLRFAGKNCMLKAERKIDCDRILMEPESTVIFNNIECRSVDQLRVAIENHNQDEKSQTSTLNNMDIAITGLNTNMNAVNPYTTTQDEDVGMTNNGYTMQIIIRPKAEQSLRSTASLENQSDQLLGNAGKNLSQTLEKNNITPPRIVGFEKLLKMPGVTLDNRVIVKNQVVSGACGSSGHCR